MSTSPLTSAGRRLLRVGIDVDPSFTPRARYAVQTLLHPLGLEPDWTPPDALEAPALYYGSPRRALPEPVVQVPFQAETAAWFEARRPYDGEPPAWMEWNERAWPVLFGPGEGEAGGVPSPTRVPGGDVIASAFFWLSGWQEVTTRARDRHGRFPYEASVQARWGLARLPVVDAYRAWIAEALEAVGVPVRRRTYAGKSWALCPTHDVDYLRKWRPGILYRETVQYLVRNHREESLRARLDRFRKVLKAWTKEPDPYRFSWLHMQRIEHERGAGATYFLKTDAQGPYDAPQRPGGRYMRERIRSLENDGFEIGLHPTYFADTRGEVLASEKARLDRGLKEPSTSVRQHYLRYAVPQTGRLHEAAGFRIDSSLGFAEHEGFRRGTCHPFQVYDTAADRPLNVWEVPVALMDSTVFNYRNLTVSDAMAAADHLMDECRLFGGVCVMLWHNILYDSIDHPGWDHHFEHALSYAQRNGAAVLSLRDALAQWSRPEEPPTTPLHA